MVIATPCIQRTRVRTPLGLFLSYAINLFMAEREKNKNKKKNKLKCHEGCRVPNRARLIRVSGPCWGPARAGPVIPCEADEKSEVAECESRPRGK